jgi:hypothetical protein
MKTIRCPICSKLISDFNSHSCEKEVKEYIQFLLSERSESSINKLEELATILSYHSLEIPNENMKWIIKESYHLYYELWNMEGRTVEIYSSLKEYEELAEGLYNNPLVMNNMTASILFTIPLREIIFNLIKNLFNKNRN